MRRRPAIAMVTMLGGLVLVSACAEEDILLARLPPTKDAGPAVEAKRCVDPTDCTGNTFCERTSCEDVAGLCATLREVCEDFPNPVCGCDGITYWNDCLRRAAGITSMRPGECEIPIAQKCGFKPGGGPGPGPGPGPSEGCQPGYYCSRLQPLMKPGGPFKCLPELPGTCWALPAQCPSIPGDRWTPCFGPVPKCTSTCDAIRSGEPFQRATTCP